MITTQEVYEALELFVKHGVLIKTLKDGETAYQDNPTFKEKTPEEQEEIFAAIEKEEPYRILPPTKKPKKSKA